MRIEVWGGRWEEGKQWIKTNCKENFTTLQKSATVYFLVLNSFINFHLQNSQINSVYSLLVFQRLPLRPLFSKCLEELPHWKQPSACLWLGSWQSRRLQAPVRLKWRNLAQGVRAAGSQHQKVVCVPALGGLDRPSPRGAHSAVGRKDADQNCKNNSLGNCFSGGINKKKPDQRRRVPLVCGGKGMVGRLCVELVLEGQKTADFLWEMKTG